MDMPSNGDWLEVGALDLQGFVAGVGPVVQQDGGQQNSTGLYECEIVVDGLRPPQPEQQERVEPRRLSLLARVAQGVTDFFAGGGDRSMQQDYELVERPQQRQQAGESGAQDHLLDVDDGGAPADELHPEPALMEDPLRQEQTQPQPLVEGGAAANSTVETQSTDEAPPGLLRRIGRLALNVVPFVGRQAAPEVTIDYWVARDENMSPETLVRRITEGTIENINTLVAGRGMLPIHDALRRGEIGVVRAIVDRLRQPEASSIGDQDPSVLGGALRLLLVDQQAEEAVSLLLSQFVEQVRGHGQIEENVVDAIHLLIIFNGVPAPRDLYFLIERGVFGIEYLRVLTENYPNVFQDRIDVRTQINENTLLHLLIEKDLREHLVLVLKNGANPSVVNQAGQTPFMFAVENNWFDMIRILLNSVTDPDDLDKAETVALHKKLYTIVNMIRQVRLDHRF